MMTEPVTDVRERSFQMKRTLLVVLVTILLAACGAKNSNDSSNSGTNNPSAKPAVGDLVVAKHAANWFAEGKIRSIEDQKANIGWSQKDFNSNDVDLANVYPIPKAGASTNVKAGDFVLAKTSTSSENTDWEGAQVTSVSSGVIAAKDSSDSSYNLAPDKVIAVSPTDAADIKSAFDKSSKNRDFDEKSHNAGRPPAPAGYKPKVDETVVVESAPHNWITGQVKSISGDKATIVWDQKNNGTVDTPLDKIVPYPTAASAVLPAVNDYILIRSGDPRLWIYVQVTSVNGTNVVVKDVNDSTSTVKPGEFILLK